MTANSQPMARPWQTIIVGRGRMGSCFVHAFHEASNREELLLEVLPARTSPLRASPRGKYRRLIILAVSDRHISAMAARVVADGLVEVGDAVVHLAGAKRVDELLPAKSQGMVVGVLHPCVAVASALKPPSLRGLSATFEGDLEALVGVQAMAAVIGLNVIHVSAVNRAAYHAAAALVATGSVALAQASALLMAQSMKLEPSGAADVAPIAHEVLSALTSSLLKSVGHNVSAVGTEAALASPLLRGDVDTIANHLHAMQAQPTALALYRAALEQVLEVLKTQQSVAPETIETAKNLLHS